KIRKSPHITNTCLSGCGDSLQSDYLEIKLPAKITKSIMRGHQNSFFLRKGSDHSPQFPIQIIQFSDIFLMIRSIYFRIFRIKFDQYFHHPVCKYFEKPNVEPDMGIVIAAKLLRRNQFLFRE